MAAFAAAAARPSSALAPVRPARGSSPPTPALVPMKFQDRPSPRLSVAFSDAGHKTRRPRRRRGGVGGARGDEASELGGSADLEAEVFEFMRRSAKPRDFPTRAQLVAAGRADLADAIAKHGGWLALGWDIEKKEEAHVESGEGIFEEDSRISQERDSSISCGTNESLGADTMASSSGRSTEIEVAEGSGVEGILSRLEKERSLAFSIGSREKRVNGQSSWRNGGNDSGDNVGGHESSRSIPLDNVRNFSHYSRDLTSQNVTSKDVSGSRSPAADMWRTWSLRRAGFPISDFEAEEIVPIVEKKNLCHDSQNEVSLEYNVQKIVQNAKGTGDEMNDLHVDAKKGQNQLHGRLQHLESELTSALQSLRVKSKDVLSLKAQANLPEELHRLSDAWEFQETEIMNAQDKLRSIRAKLAVLEGKMALEIIEAQKVMDEKQKRLDAAQYASCLLRTVYIVWPNSASEVSLAGSFDGWTSQRTMERSTAGIFSLYLKLYPGRYEIKFIVDGVWRVDPLRPTVYNNGYQNNILIVT